MSDFDPPPYIGKLISAINDGAKSAQLGAVAFVFIGLFLLATSFSATDEDLLIGKSISISQLGGVTVPVVLSFGFMPAIFLALHLYTLIRFDLLMQNLRHFEAELRAHVPLQRDRDRCLQLLANTEFIQAAVQPEASFVFRWTYRFMLAVFPVTVLLLVQLGSLRLQSDVVNIVHHITILLDILLLIWFFRRQRPSGDSVLLWLFKRGRFVLPALVLGFNFAWCRVPSAEATTVGAGKWEELREQLFLRPDAALSPKQRVDLAFASLRQPVDLLLCPHVGLGCRYLSVPGRTLVGKVWDNGAFVQLRAGEELDGKRRAAFDPLVLQNKRLRFANLSRTQFFNVDLSGADLRRATLNGAFMQQAQLNGAQLQGASLFRAQLQGALIADAQIWRLRAPEAALDDAQLRDLGFSDAAPCPDRVRPGEACPNPRSWAGWIEEWTKFIPAGQRRDAAQQRLAILTAEDQAAGAETAQGTWRIHPPQQPEAVAKRLGDLACGPDHAPYIARSILGQIWREQPRNLGTQRQTLAARMLSADCPGAKDLTERELSRLRDIAAGRE